jgi:hypothetical protein
MSIIKRLSLFVLPTNNILLNINLVKFFFLGIAAYTLDEIVTSLTPIRKGTPLGKSAKKEGGFNNVNLKKIIFICITRKQYPFKHKSSSATLKNLVKQPIKYPKLLFQTQYPYQCIYVSAK